LPGFLEQRLKKWLIKTLSGNIENRQEFAVGAAPPAPHRPRNIPIRPAPPNNPPVIEMHCRPGPRPPGPAARPPAAPIGSPPGFRTFPALGKSLEAHPLIKSALPGRIPALHKTGRAARPLEEKTIDFIWCPVGPRARAWMAQPFKPIWRETKKFPVAIRRPLQAPAPENLCRPHPKPPVKSIGPLNDAGRKPHPRFPSWAPQRRDKFFGADPVDFDEQGTDFVKGGPPADHASDYGARRSEAGINSFSAPPPLPGGELSEPLRPRLVRIFFFEHASNEEAATPWPEIGREKFGFCRN